ncbi:MAG: hypothetical protein ACKO0Z_17630 [Betaproteobacteria bacterium]
MTNLSSAYRSVIEQYSNENILLNVVRSSRNMPMSFLDIPSVVGTGSVVTEASANVNVLSRDPGTFGGFFAPGAGSSVGASAGMAVNNGFTFTQASLDNAEFMKSFLRQIPVGVVGFRGTQQLLPRAVSYTLLIESVELQSKGNVVSRFQNDPDDPNYQSFQDLLYVLIESGLTVESIPKKIPIGPALLHTEISKTLETLGQPLLNGLTTGGVVIDKVPGANPARYQINRIEEKTVLCVNRYRAHELLGNLLSPDAYCVDSPKYVRENNQGFRRIVGDFAKNFPEQKDMALVITLRSAANVFNFLGRVVRAQLDPVDPKTVMIQPGTGVLDPYNKRYYQPEPLFKVYKNAKLQHSVATVSYGRDVYQVADEDDSYSKQVLEFMSSLLTVSKIPGAIPSSPAVIVR